MPRPPVTSTGPTTARAVAADALTAAAEAWPDLEPTPLDTDALAPRDARLALAIHRTVLQRWLTLEHLLDVFLKRPLRSLEPGLQGVLLSASAQLVFMERLPVHAVVDESVSLARSRVRAGAAGLVNAVLRKLAQLIEAPVHDATWAPAPDRLPTDDGFVPLTHPALPGVDDLAQHLAAATSHPAPLVRRWLDAYGPEDATAVCRHGVLTPPTIVAVDPGFVVAASVGGSVEPHTAPDFVVWRGDRAELAAFLKADARRRVQDPASAEPVHATGDLNPSVIVDYCAGRGTKTRQLAALHPGASVLASDTHADRLTSLREVAEACDQVTAVAPGPAGFAEVLNELNRDAADLLVLDVPCSNTAVLARRPEARYRFRPKTLSTVTALQRKIIRQATPLVAPGGYVLYATCSLESAENQDQARWAAEQLNADVERESLTLPGGQGDSYHDGSYFALLRVK